MRYVLSRCGYVIAGGLLAALMAKPHIAQVKRDVWYGGYQVGKQACEEGV